MMRALTKAFESHTIDVDSSPSGSIYPSFSSFDENIANEYNEWEVSMDKIFARCRICDRRKIKIVASTLANDVTPQGPQTPRMLLNYTSDIHI
jgi:hypothetical protein